ncbi:AraC family transcriptional regulator [Robertkochia flava]|uniref:AraC family transcriptional regulator n=1 Tax=Robertkochia flava TaxID=3447986 RepID=UPI001CCFACF6|nr:AraC family transcriptional regulator [Robertkochia marina]
MARINLHNAFIVNQWETDTWDVSPHKQNYFELVFIEEGKGIHTINEIEVPYQKGAVFLLAPNDEHSFEIETKTRFTNIRFTELFFSSKTRLPDRTDWLQRIEPILHHPNIIPGDAIANDLDRKIVWLAKEMIVLEYEAEREFYLSILTNGVSTILSILARNIIQKYKIAGSPTPTVYINRSDEILHYIRLNVYDSDKMKIENLAKTFHMSPNYINNFFKKETGESIRQYILNYKLLISEFRLRNTSAPISEIAHQLGFNDESHFTKTFKKKHQVTPKEYRDTHGHLLHK